MPARQERRFLMVWLVCSGCAIALLCTGSVAAIPEALAVLLVPYLVFRRAAEPPPELSALPRRPVRGLVREPSTFPNSRPTALDRHG